MTNARALAILLVLAPATALAEPQLRVCMDTALAPWSYIPTRLPRFDEDPAKSTPLPPATPAEIKTAVGVDVDVARAVARRTGAALQIVQTSWFGLEEALAAGSCDAIVNAWTPTRHTPPSIAASDPYLTWGLQVAVRKDDTRFKEYTDLAGHAVGHIADPAVELTLRALSGAKLIPYPLNRTLFYALQTGKLDAAAHDSTYIAWRIGRGDPFRTVGGPLNKLGYHVGVLKTSEGAARILAAAKDLVASDEMAAIQNRWSQDAR
jgi:ABC-type amino acid transport substrate-binding protein